HLDYLDKNNTPAADYAIAATAGITRAADLASTTNGVATGNTRDDRDRLRIRARLAVAAKVSDSWSAGLRLTTRNLTERGSTNHTLGQDFNKYPVVWDQAYLKFDPAPWFTAAGGRIPNPFFSTDLVFAEDLGFEGVAMSLKPALAIE